MVGPVFSTSSMNEFEPTVKRYSAKFIENVRATASDNAGLIDLDDWFNRFSFDVPAPAQSDRRSSVLWPLPRISVASRAAKHTSTSQR